MQRLTLLLLVLALLPSVDAKTKPKKKNERFYQEVWCTDRGISEFILPDRTRVDCLTETHAIEFDWAKKWAEGIGQSLYYSLQTGKRAGVVLILKRRKHYKYWIRLNSTIDQFGLPIDTWLIEVYEL
ncbi:MAG: hypothetical protein ACPGSM_20365 [Thiolinea sp.]